MELQITEFGRELVRTPEFTAKLRQLAQHYHEQNVGEAVGKTIIISRIAQALCRDPDAKSDPTVEEIVAFIDKHVVEINAVAQNCLTTAMAQDGLLGTKSVS